MTTTTVGELLELLADHDPETPVMIAHQPGWPLAEALAGLFIRPTATRTTTTPPATSACGWSPAATSTAARRTRRAGCSMPLPSDGLFTKNGRDFLEVASLLQKSLRRGDVVMCSRAVNELLPRYANYCWNRMMTVSAEDCADLVTGEVVALYDAWVKVNAGKGDKSKGRVFFAKAIIILARCRHSRDADELNLLVADRLPDDEFDAAIAACEPQVTDVDDPDWTIPEWALDVHTRRGRVRGKTKKQFIREEHDALVRPMTLFENFDEMAASRTYVEPQLKFGE
jgi:hypothetical protein